MINQHPTPFPQLNTLLQDLVTGAQEILDNNFSGAYLQGSLTTERPDEHGDVDFIIVINRPLTTAEQKAINNLHGRLFEQESYWAKHLEGSYFPKDTLRRRKPSREPLFYLDNGDRELIWDEHDDTHILRWILLERGITLSGPAPQELIDPISAADLLQEVRGMMQSWAEEIYNDPQSVNNGWYQPYIVLSFCRMLLTLHSGRIESKETGARWAQTYLDDKWSGLIERAWQARTNQYEKIYQPAETADVVLTIDFVDHILKETWQIPD